MSKRDQFRFSAVSKFLQGEVSRIETATLLQVTVRTVSRIARRIEKKSFLGVTHGNRGSRPQNKHDELLRTSTMKLVEDRYFDFNMTHCLELLKEEQGFEISYSVFRRWCHAHHIVKRKQRRRSKAHVKRVRMASEGLLLQFDGSHHRWNGKDVWCLIAAIDDATSDIPYAEFFLSEDTLNCMAVMQRIVEAKGIPYAVYVDRAGWFGGQKRQMFAQFKRACEDLNIDVIFANSPQAKGRIERAWDTFQDRLIPEMRLKNIKRMPAANEYLQQQFLPNYWKQKNTVIAHSPEIQYRKLPAGIDLKEIFCRKEHRTVKSDHTISWEGITYVIDSALKYSIQKQEIELRTYQDMTWKAFFAGKPISIKPFEKAIAAQAAA
jgi:transposase